MPTPGKNETQDEFVSRCVPIVLDDGTADDQEQAVAICHSMWENKAVGGTARRAYSTFTVKSVDKKQRIIEGIASSPCVDRVGDIVEPLGAKFSLPMPLLWQHDAERPIGHVIDAKATKDGITFKAQLVEIKEPGRLKERTDEAWQSISSVPPLVRGVSIGFRGEDVEPIDKKDPFGGQRFKTWSWYELSCVTIPANVEASIINIRSFDNPNLQEMAKPGRPTKPSAGAGSFSTKIERGQTIMAKQTNGERIKSLENKRAAEIAARDAIHEKVMEEDRTKDEAEQTEFDEHSATIKAIDRELADCRLIEKELIATAKPLIPHDDGVDVGEAKHIRVRGPVLEKGQGLMKLLACKLHAKQFNRDVIAVARQFCSDYPQVEMELKAAVAMGTTTGTTWAAPFVYPQQLTSEFFELLFAETFLGKIRGFTMVPFNSRVIRDNSTLTAQWVGEGRAKPLAAGSFDTVSLVFNKTALIMGVTQELAKFSNPSIELKLRDDLTKSIAQFLDQQAIDPNVTVITGVRPASLTNGADHDAASGTDITAVVHDIREILFHFQEYNISTSGVTLVMQPVLATSIGTMMTTLGVMQFPNVTADGGNILGIPVVTSNNSPSGQITAIHAPSVLMANEGIQLDASTEASVQLADNPTSSQYQLVSAFQNNLLFIRAEQFITWARGRDKGVYYLTNAAYGGAVTG